MYKTCLMNYKFSKIDVIKFRKPETELKSLIEDLKEYASFSQC